MSQVSMPNKHQCGQCFKSMSSKSNLARHMLAHSGVKAHTCSECKKSFGEADALRKHMITHTGEKLHRSAQCGDSFGHLKQHSTLGRSHTNAHSAIMHLCLQAILKITSKHISKGQLMHYALIPIAKCQ